MTTKLIRRTHRQALAPNPFGDFDQMLAGFLRPAGDLAPLGRDGWTPAVDVRETEDAYLVDAELPGLTKDDVNVTFNEGVLTISGERKLEEKTAEEGYRRVERRYGSFSRAFNLTHEVDTENVKASFKDGLLSISVPKREQVKPRAIKIN